MSKLTKLVKQPRLFIRDAKLYRKFFDQSERAAPPRQGDGKKGHPLPTLNLAEEIRLTKEESQRASSSRAFLRFQSSSEVRERVLLRLAARVDEFFTGLGFPSRSYEQDLRDFFIACETNPALGAARTTAAGSLVWLFMLARVLEPKAIVESGVYKGASLFNFARACPDAKLYAYDIDLSNLLYISPKLRLYEGDWSEAFPRAESAGDLCYFDDHINNCLRIRQAYELGFRHVVFDDSPDIGELHKWRFPGVPTIQMVMNGTLRDGEWVEWVWKDRRLTYVYRDKDTYGAAELVEAIAELPSLSALTGRPAGVQTYVRLRSSD